MVQEWRLSLPVLGGKLAKSGLWLNFPGVTVPEVGGGEEAGCSAPPLSPPHPQCGSHILSVGSLAPHFPSAPSRPTLGLRRECGGAGRRGTGGRAGLRGVRGAAAPAHLVSRYVGWERARGSDFQDSRWGGGTPNGVSGEKWPISAALAPTHSPRSWCRAARE